MVVKIVILNSFAKTNLGGNPAGVVLNAENLSAKDMQTIAKKIGVSETAFVKKSDKADFKVQFFTPGDEVDLCGHATIAAFSLLKQQKLIKKDKYFQETKAGILSIEVNDDDFVYMDQTLPSFSEIVEEKIIAEALGIPTEKITATKLKPQVVSTGLRDIIAPVNSMEALFCLNPNYEKIKQLSLKYNTIGVHVFTLESITKKAVALTRNFAPLYDINEESATGTANGALSCYLFKNEVLNKNSLSLTFDQGYNMNKPSEIFSKIKIKENKIEKIQVGGKAIKVNEIFI